MNESYSDIFWKGLIIVLAAIILGIIYYFSDDIEKLPAFMWLVFPPLMMTSIFCLGQIEFNAHVFWLIFFIGFALAFVAAFFYNNQLEATLGGRNQGIVWVFISVACFVSFVFLSRT